MENKDKIEIPFGAKDSELYECEYTIPEGYEAEIKDGKVIIIKKESEDEKIRKEIIDFIKSRGGFKGDWIAWLEKQGEQKQVVIPKFRVGDIIRWKKAGSIEYTIKEINDKGYINTANGIMDISQTDIEFELIKQKPTEWSEKDEEMYKKVKTAINSYYAPFSRDAEEMSEWFKNLKDRVQPQPKQEWNEEDEKMYTATIFALAGFMGNEDKLDWLKNKLKSLRHQKQDVMSVDEFRHIVGYLVQDIVANEHMAETEKQPTKFFVEKYYKKLRPQSTWKPSDEQMDAVKRASNGSRAIAGNDYLIMESLYQDLKKL